MSAKLTPGGYVARDSLMHRMDPRAKVVATVALMVAAMLAATGAQLALAAACALALCAASGIGPVALIRSILALVLGLAVVAALNIFVVRDGTVLAQWGPIVATDAGLETAGLFAARLTLLVAQGSLLLMTTTPTQLTQAFSRLLAPLKLVHVPVDELALILSIGLRFIPTLSDEVQMVRDAQRARGSSLARGGPVKRMRSLVAILVPTLAATLRHAEGLSLALEARCWVAGAPRTVWHPFKMRATDWAYLAFCAAYCVAMTLL